jgi:HK97 gp10 family phage protein
MANTIKGLQAAIRQLQTLKEKSRQAMRRGEKKIADKIAAQASANAPVKSGILKNSIGVEQTDVSTTVYAAAKHAPYQEFGTGPLTQVPTGYEDYAREFYVNGEGHTPPQPFFFPAVFLYQQEIIPSVEEELAKI